MINGKLFLLFTIITPSISQNIRSLFLSQVNDVKYQCNSPACLPSTVVSTSDLKDCQFICLSNAECRTITFDQSINQCEIFADIPSINGNLSTQIGVVTMSAIDERQSSAPNRTDTTTRSTTSTTSNTSTASSTTSSTTTTTFTTTTTKTTTTGTTTTTTTAAICTASPNTWFETSASMPPQCSNYTIDTDPTRNAVFYNSNITGLCDDTSPFSNKPVWFRFLPPAGTAIINYTVPNGYCGTSAPGWYAGQYPSTIYTTATSIACYVIGSNLCWQCNQMSVTNCNTFFVFGLPRSATCNCRYCTM